MRSWASVGAIVVAAACRPSAAQTSTPQPQLLAAREPPRICVAIDAHCDAEIQDAAVLELVKGRCWGCHGTNGIAGHDFPDIAALRKAPVDYMIGSCQMPPDGAPLAEAARRLLVDWASCKPPLSGQADARGTVLRLRRLQGWK